ncbi:MAG TPA: hypothetical protein PLQ29_06150 [Spirochaetales bacterium]|nr:hypothetical protein [Spirochaetales bacterium]HPG86265.1 hypothetical protein [Spirochaetales bacterium]HPM73889.1 hypothetical protein [Spirochaetales bacterium]
MIITLYRPSAEGPIRYYTIHDRQPLLTARYSLTIAWRTGEGREREKVYGFDTLADKDKKIKQVFARKTRDGYSLLYSFIREIVSAPESIAVPESARAADA